VLLSRAQTPSAAVAVAGVLGPARAGYDFVLLFRVNVGVHVQYLAFNPSLGILL